MKITEPRCHTRSFPSGFAYDPLPDFNCNDPAPFPIPRPRVSLWRRLFVWVSVAGVAALIVTLVACGFTYSGQALFVWLSS